MSQKIIYFLILLSVALTPAANAGQELIAYTHLTDGYWQLWVMDPSGGNKRQVTFSAQDKRNPDWLMHGQKLAYRTNNGQLFLVGLDGQNETEILSAYRAINNPHFSAKDDQVVFVRFAAMTKDIGDIWISDLEEKNARVISKYTGLQFQPNISPQGDKVCFVRVDPDTKAHNLWIMNSDGKNARQLTKRARYNSLPAFSPDGQEIIFASNSDSDNFEIFTVTLDGKITQVTNNQALDTSPIYSLDGKSIVFVSDQSGSQQIWKMDRDGQNAVQLTTDSAESMDPIWVVQ